MSAKVVVVKQAGSHPPTEGVLAEFADIYEFNTMDDVNAIANMGTEVILLDVNMPALDPNKILDLLRERPHNLSLVMLYDSEEAPTKILASLRRLGALQKKRGRPPTIRHIINTIGIAQERLGRILNVSSRTINRWLSKTSQPKMTPELDKLLQIVAALEKTLPDRASIRRYLNYPNPNLKDEKPIDLLLRGEFVQVEDDLEAIQEGVYT